MEQPVINEPQPTPGTTSLAARLLNVFAIPGDVFEEVKASPPTPSNWIAPAVLLVLVGWIGLALVFSQDSIRYQLTEMTEKAIQKQIETNKIPEAQAEGMRNLGAIGLKVNVAMMPVLMGFIPPFFWGLMFWLIGAKLLKNSFSFMKAVEVAGLANGILVLESIVRTLIVILSGNFFASPSLALLVKDFDPQNPAHGMLAAVNVMTFWLLIVRSIGLARLASLSFSKGAMWVFGVWASYTGFFLAVAWAMQALFGGQTGAR